MDTMGRLVAPYAHACLYGADNGVADPACIRACQAKLQRFEVIAVVLYTGPMVGPSFPLFKTVLLLFLAI